MKLAKLIAIFWGLALLPVALCVAVEPSGYTGGTVATATNIQPVVTLSRSSGVTPAFVQASAYLTTGTGISHPYTDIEFAWNGGDPTMDNISHPYFTGASVSVNGGQKAPEALFCYRTAGTYTIRVTCRVWTGSAYVTAVGSTTFTATAWSGTERYYDSVAGSPTGAGTIGDPISSESDLRTWLRAGNDRKALIKAGSTFTLTATWEWGPSTSVTRSGQRLEKYGSGADPVITTSVSGGQRMCYANCNNVNILWRDFVATDITFNGAEMTRWPVQLLSSTGTMSNIYFDSCTLMGSNTVDGSKCLYLGTDETTPCDGSGYYRCLLDGGTTAETGMLNDSEGDYHAYFACEFTGGKTGNVSTGIDVTLDHHLYPSSCSHLLIAYTWFHDGGNFGYCVNGNCHNDGGLPYEEDYHCYTDSWFSETRNGIDASSTGGNSNVGQIGRVLCQRSWFTGMGNMPGTTAGDMTINTGSSWVFYYSAARMVIRDCQGWDNTPDVGIGTPVLRVGNGTNAVGLNITVDFYRNKVVIPSTFDSTQEWIRIDDPTNAITISGSIRDNTILDLRSNSRILNVPYVECVNTWSNNRIFHPNDASLVFRNNNLTNGVEADFEAVYGSGAVDLTNGNNPAWVSPTTGIFERPFIFPGRRR